MKMQERGKTNVVKYSHAQKSLRMRRSDKAQLGFRVQIRY